MAFTVDLTDGEGACMPVDGGLKHFVLRRTVDFSDAANSLIATATMGLFDIPAYVSVREVFAIVTDADAGVTDIDIGSYSTAGVVNDVDGFMDGGDPSSTGILRDTAGETYSIANGTVGYQAAAAWTIGLINNGAGTLDDAIITFCAECIDLR